MKILETLPATTVSEVLSSYIRRDLSLHSAARRQPTQPPADSAPPADRRLSTLLTTSSDGRVRCGPSKLVPLHPFRRAAGCCFLCRRRRHRCGTEIALTDQQRVPTNRVDRRVGESEEVG